MPDPFHHVVIVSPALPCLPAFGLAPRVEADAGEDDADILDTQLVTLDQMAALVSRRKSCLRGYRGEMPPPRVRGRRGQPSLWAWSDVRGWLTRTFGRRLPERFPG